MEKKTIELYRKKFDDIKPENLPASEDIKKLERRVKREEKKLAEQSGKLTNE